MGTTPLKFGDRLCHLGFEGCTGVPTVTGDGTLGGHLLASPHDDVTVLGTSTQNSPPMIVRDGNDLVLEEKTLESGFS